MTPEKAFAAALAAAQTDHTIDNLVVAVSGGGDSMALLHVAQAWGRAQGKAVSALTVDHGLRDEAATEAARVAEICADLGVAHRTLDWPDWDGQGNLQAMARAARYDLIADAAPAGAAILIGHTMDDAAETFLMRLARGSGVDGLSRMRSTWTDRGHLWLRPFLTVRRAALRDWLHDREIGWIDDPTNDDTQYDRVRMRQALDLLAPLGIDAERLTMTAQAMTEARQALEHWAEQAARCTAWTEAGDVLFDRAKVQALPRETHDRLIAHAIGWVASAAYRPRRAALMQAVRDVTETGRATLGGCLLTAKGDTLRVGREPKAVADLRASPPSIWDNRWRLSGPDAPSGHVLAVRALGAGGLSDCPDWRETGLPRETLLASPAVFAGDRLVAAPLAGHPAGWRAELCPPRGDFFTSLLSH
ncbi:tRNA lysidine(34) synthetase TilS [Maritimibacter alexandrii]|uniref:tRNA lysidine(34) synthetase TilS n=1 Tax=Maritimibacter alexandrii TaxID=2570355 RepID=UPI001F43A021|nr:tRNA lysidine(34) synthetase TilS [Maritimibacter alexandrii]